VAIRGTGSQRDWRRRALKELALGCHLLGRNLVKENGVVQTEAVSSHVWFVARATVHLQQRVVGLRDAAREQCLPKPARATQHKELVARQLVRKLRQKLIHDWVGFKSPAVSSEAGNGLLLLFSCEQPLSLLLNRLELLQITQHARAAPAEELASLDSGKLVRLEQVHDPTRVHEEVLPRPLV